MYSQNTGGSYFDTQGGSTQVTTVVSSHNMVGTGAIQMGVSGGQIISSSGGTYLIGNSMENSGHSVSHTTRASPATVSALLSVIYRRYRCEKTIDLFLSNRKDVAVFLCISF